MARTAWIYSLLLLVVLAGGSLRRHSARSLGDAPPPPHTDAADYWEIGGAVAAGAGFALDGRLTASRGALSALPAAAVRALGGNPGDMRALHALLGTLLIPLLFLIGRALGSREAGLAAAAFAAFSQTQIAFSASLGVECLFTVVTAFAAWMAARWAERPSPGRAAALGAALGLTLLTRSTLFLLPPLLALYALRITRPAARGRRAAAWLLIACAAVLLPWTLRNGLTLGHWLPTETGNAGVVFYEGTLRVERSPLLTESEPAVTVMSVYPAHLWTPVFANLGMRNILAAPLRYARLCLTRFVRLWTDTLPATVDDVPAPPGLPRGLETLFKVLFLCGALWGAAAGGAGPRLMLLFLAAFSLHVFFSHHARYAGQIAPLLAAAGGAGLAAAWRSQRRRLAPLLLAVFASACAAAPQPSPQALRDPQALKERAAALVRARRPAAALPLFDRLLKDLPGSPEARFNRAACLVLLGRYAEAEDDLNLFTRYAQTIPKNLLVAARRRRAALRITRRDYAGAREDLRKALALAASTAERREIARTLAILGRV